MQQRFWRRSARAVVLLAAITPAMAQVRYPDLRVIVPTDRFSIAQTQTGREFRYTHDTFNGGALHWRFSRSITRLLATIKDVNTYTLLADPPGQSPRRFRLQALSSFMRPMGIFTFLSRRSGFIRVAADNGLGAP